MTYDFNRKHPSSDSTGWEKSEIKDVSHDEYLNVLVTLQCPLIVHHCLTGSIRKALSECGIQTRGFTIISMDEICNPSWQNSAACLNILPIKQQKVDKEGYFFSF